MAAAYTAIIQETDEDLEDLHRKTYSLQVAKSVSAPGAAPSYNVVYESSYLANNMSVGWSTIYGLNWLSNMPAPGDLVWHNGIWQRCELGQSFDLNEAGEWVPNQSDPNSDPNSLNVGSNGYQTDVHIIVGVQDPDTKEWKIIWVGEDALIRKAHGEYQPHESIHLWYQEGDLTSTMITNHGTEFQDFDMTMNPTYYFSYSTTDTDWLTPQAQPFF
ncbi:hypothetical protein THAR02_04217 [Trichoderma harzianum]|uniref:Uncharacterized protein n=1 Tax=Trichoderma harzianum TaxID=5544 RepID=A0A0F9XF79_TRIHA|nr:hypothetical protein THAR02_04217 [Trichoderma harzianum]